MEANEPIVDERLIALWEEGVLETAGELSLDLERARAKLRALLEPRPQEFVLALVQAASLRGAASVEFAIDREDARVFFGGAPYSIDELRRLYSVLFDQTGDALGEGLRALASALLSAMAERPLELRLLSGDPERRAYLRLGGDGEESLRAVGPRSSGTFVHMRGRHQPGDGLRFSDVRDGVYYEVALLRERCRFSEMPVIVNGEQVSQGLAIAGLLGAIDIDDGELCGVMGFDPALASGDPGPATLELLRGGVWLGAAELPGFPAGLRVRVDGGWVTRACLATGEDEARGRLLALLAAARDRAFVALAGAAGDEAPAGVRAALKAELLARRLADEAAALEGDPLLAVLWELHVWDTSDGVRLSTRALAAGEDELQYAHRALCAESLPEAVGAVVLVADDEAVAAREAAFLRAVVGERAIDVSRSIERERRYAESVLRWRERTHPPALGESFYLVRRRLELEGLHGEVGLRGVGSDRCAVRLVREGCLLQQVAIELPVPGLDAVIQADFTPNRAFNAAHRNEVLARAVCELLVALEGLMAQLARAWLEHPRGLADARALFMPYIFAVLEPEFGVGILRAFGFSPGSAARYIRQLGGERFIPEWGLDVDAPHPLAQVAVFETCAGEGVSLATIGAWLRERGEIAYLAVERGAQPSLEVPALLLTEEQRRALEILFGDAALVDFEPQLARAMRRAAFLRQPEEALELPGELLATASCEHGGVQLVLGLTRAGLRTERLSSTSAPLRVLKRRRFLGELRVSVMLPGIVGVANYDEAVASDDHTGLDPGASTAAIDAAALEGVAALIQAGAEACQAAPAACPDELRRFLLLVAAFLFEHPQIFRAYTAVRAAVGEEAACLELVELGELADRYTHSRVVSTVELIIERGGTPRAELVREILERRTKREPSGEHRPRTRVRGRTLRCFPALEAAPLLRTSGGKTMTLGEALASAREHGRIYYASPRADANYYDGFERTVVLLDSPDRHALSRLVGSEALESADDWITERSRQRSGVHEAASSRPRVPVGERLTAIDVDVDGFSGQVGLRRWGPDADEPACVRLLSRGHSLATIFPSLSLPVIGALEHPELALDEATGQVIEPLRGRAIAAVEGAQAPLLTALGDRWAELDPYEVEEASRWVMELLADKAPRLGEDATALARASEDPVLERLTRLPAFAGIDGRRYSLAALTEARQRHGGLRYVTAAWVHALPELPVVVTDPERIPVLQALFGEIVDHAVEWQREQRVRERRARARRLPALPPRDALEAVRIDSRGLSGWLWVMGNDGHDACVRLGHEGLEVERRAISDLFACDGAVAITKPDLITAEWDAVQLTRRQEQTLAAAAVQLFRDLIDTHDAALAEGQGAPVSLKGRRRRGLDPTVDPARVRQALAGLLTRLHHSKRDGRHVLRSAHRRIYRQLADTPMFELANHRLVSLNTALEERPAELAHLGFWESAAVTAEVGGREHSGAHLSVEIEGLPRPSAAQALLEAVRVELRIVSAITSDLMAEAFLDLLSIGALPADSDDDDEPLVVGEQRGYVVINVLHPVVAAAIDRAEYDPLLVSVVAAAVHGYFVLWAGERADEEVRAFVDDHTRHVLSGARQNGAAREPA